MDKIIEKIDSYDIFTNLLPGIILVFLFDTFLSIQLVQGNIIEDLFIYYFIGIIVSRVGSLIVEPFCKKIKLINFKKYNDYIAGVQKDNKIETLSKVNNTYRSILSACIITLVIKLYCHVSIIFNLPSSFNKDLGLLALCVLFSFSYRKQSSYIVKRIDKINKKDN